MEIDYENFVLLWFVKQFQEISFGQIYCRHLRRLMKKRMELIDLMTSYTLPEWDRSGGQDHIKTINISR